MISVFLLSFLGFYVCFLLVFVGDKRNEENSIGADAHVSRRWIDRKNYPDLQLDTVNYHLDSLTNRKDLMSLSVKVMPESFGGVIGLK